MGKPQAKKGKDSTTQRQISSNSTSEPLDKNRLHGPNYATIMQPKRGLILGSGRPKLSPSEKEVLRLLTIEFLMPIQIAYIRQTSHQAVYKIIRNLRKKGAISGANSMVADLQSSMQPMQPFQIRLHGQEWNIRILYQDEKYKQALKRTNLLELDGNTIRLYENSLEIYSGKSFIANDKDSATRESLEYWKSFFARLENELKVILVKNRSQNIKLVNEGHYARTNSEIFENTIKKEGKIKVFDPIDGKLAFVTDDSFGLGEDETLHPKTSNNDRGNIDKQINDWRLNNPMTNSELANAVINLAKINVSQAEQNKETAAGLNALVNLFKMQFPQNQPKKEEIKIDESSYVKKDINKGAYYIG